MEGNVHLLIQSNCIITNPIVLTNTLENALEAGGCDRV